LTLARFRVTFMTMTALSLLCLAAAPARATAGPRKPRSVWHVRV
jgi:hypothetical protein